MTQKTKPPRNTALQQKPPTVMTNPEFCDFAEARRRFGLSRTHLYRLIAEGSITSVAARRQNKARGRRLLLVESIRAFLMANIDVSHTANSKGGHQ
jgi:hypothetical protein